MKVLFVASGNKDGKPGAVVQNQSNSFNIIGLKIDFFLIKGTGIKGYLKNIIPLIKYIKKHNYDVIHSHYSLSALVTTIALWFFPNKPHIISLMGSDTKTKGVYKYIVKFCSRFFWNKIIVKSESMKNDIGIKKADIIPNGVDLQKIIKLENHKGFKQNYEEKEKILFAADPKRYCKNVPLALSAAELAGKEIQILYNKPHEEILKAILNADILLLTSHWEGSPNIIKEAMACNCPIVATDVGDIKWLFGSERGHFLASFEPSDVADKIAKALEFSKMYNHTKGRNRILELGLDAETIARRIVGLYEEVLQR